MMNTEEKEIKLPDGNLNREEIKDYLAKIDEELADETRPVDQYDLSALYLQVGLDFLAPHEEKIEVLGKVAMKENYRLNRLCHILVRELGNIQGHLVNIDKRVYALEEQSPRKNKAKYK